MAEITPFSALRFTDAAGKIEDLACPPYDIISEAQRKQYLACNEHNIIRLELPREGEDPYKTAGATLLDWLGSGILAEDDAPGLYLYEEEFEALGRRMTVKGLVCRVTLEPWSAGVVLPHEETLSKAKEDRLNLMKATGCNFSSVYSLYFDEKGEITGRIERLSAGEPEVEFASDDGIIHRVWKISNPGETDAICGLMGDKKLYIADGHHRYETALNYRSWLREQGVAVDGGHPADSILMTLVPMEHPGLVVFPTHRIVRDLDGFDKSALLEACAQYFAVEEMPLAAAEAALAARYDTGEKAVALYHGGRAHLLTLRDGGVMKELLGTSSEAYQQLDVNLLHILILERLLGIDKENMANQRNLTYTRDIEEAVQAVDGGQANCAFLLNPTRVSEIAQVAAAGEKMPQKSTYFYPKLITGHIMNRMVEM